MIQSSGQKTESSSPSFLPHPPILFAALLQYKSSVNPEFPQLCLWCAGSSGFPLPAACPAHHSLTLPAATVHCPYASSPLVSLQVFSAQQQQVTRTFQLFPVSAQSESTQNPLLLQLSSPLKKGWLLLISE